MRSDNDYGRLVKLWISVWNLVLEGKRHLEAVTALLQRIVFEEKGYPTFKNWPAICRLGKEDRFLMMAVATVDLSSESETVHQLIAAFPACFSLEQTAGPVPLSVIRENARQHATRKRLDINEPEDFPVICEAIPKEIPVQNFDKYGHRVAGFEGPRLPEEIDPDSHQGAIVTWNGKEFVVVENNRSCEELAIVPAECIAVEL